MSRLNFSDGAAVAAWLSGLRTSLKDADDMTRDMLRRKRKRDFGHALHKENYTAAWQQIAAAMALAGAPLDEENGPPEPPASRPRLRTPKPEGGGDGGPEGGNP